MRFFFAHAMKTGGISVRFGLGSHGGLWPTPPRTIDGRLSLLPLNYAPPSYHVAGHYPAAAAQLLHGDSTTMTVLRDPIERTVSWLRYHQRQEHIEEPLAVTYENTVLARSLVVDNHQTTMLGATLDEVYPRGLLNGVTPTEEHLERAIERLDDILWATSPQALWDAACALAGWPSSILPYRNAAPLPTPSISNPLRERIAADNALDLALWEHIQ